MTRFLRSSVLQHPEKIHPSLWRGSQLAHSFQKTVSTGYQELDKQLPGQGWPTGALIEIMSARHGIGEMQLLKPALLKQANDRSIVLVNPPYIPSSLSLQHWFSEQHVFWIRSDTTRNTLWAAEKILQHNTSAALLCWITDAHPASLQRLHLAARQSHTLFFSMRPASVATQSSVAPLRLRLDPYVWGLNISVLKRRGPQLNTAIPVYLQQPDTSASSLTDAPHKSRTTNMGVLSTPLMGHKSNSKADAQGMLLGY